MSVKNWVFGAQIISGKGYDGPKADAKNADKKVKYCPDCNRCWILNEFSLPHKHEPEYYVDFPTYGKQVKACPRCDEENEILLANSRAAGEGDWQDG